MCSSTDLAAHRRRAVRETQVAIVGGGLAGLVCADELHRRGAAVVVLEAAARLGGRVHTVTFPDGVTGEAGMEEFWAGNPATSLIDELGLPVRVDRAHSSVVIDGELCVYQGDGDRDRYLSGIFDDAEVEAFLAWDALVRRLSAEIAGSSASDTVSPLTVLATTSLAALVRSVVPAPRVATWIRLVVETEAATEWHRISALDGLAELRPFLDRAEGFGEDNVHVVGGNTRLVEGLRARLPDSTVVTGVTARRIATTVGGIEVEAVDGHGRRIVVRADHAVSTLPAWALRDVVVDVAPPPLARRALAGTAAAPYVKALVRLRPAARSGFEGHGPGLFTLLTGGPGGCVYLSDPADGRDLLLTVLVHGTRARELCRLDRRAVARTVVADLEHSTVRRRSERVLRPLLANLSAYVTDTFVACHPHAVATWPVDRGRSRFDAAAASLRAPWGRLHVGGDTVEGTHSDGAVVSARRIAARVASALRLPAQERPSVAAPSLALARSHLATRSGPPPRIAERVHP